MKLGQELFSVKLHELKQEYGRLQTRIRLFSTQDTEQARRELAQLQDEYQQQDLLLVERIRACRSPCAASLAAAQSDYDRRVEQILLEELPTPCAGTTGPVPRIRRRPHPSMQNTPSILPPSPCVMP